MQRILLTNAEKCTGCRICEIVCSLHHEKECNPEKSRIHIIKWEESGLDIPMVCQQCEIPICEKVCPVRAISRDQKTGAIIIDGDTCVRCRMCLIACPFGGISMNLENKKMIKCDLCEGRPTCAELCPTQALEYTTATKAILLKQRAAAEKMGELIKAFAILS